VFSVLEDPLRCWKIQAFEHHEDAIQSNSFQNSIAHCANLISSRLIDAEIPHNLIITDKGRTFYFIPRQFENQLLQINTCWNDLAGLVTVKKSEDFEDLALNEDKILNILRDNVSLRGDAFESLTESFMKIMNSIYVMEKF
jgi:hypothetical protein